MEYINDVINVLKEDSTTFTTTLDADKAILMEDDMFDFIKNQLMFKYPCGYKDIHFYNEDNKCERSGCDLEDINVGYFKYRNRDKNIYEYSFQILYPESMTK